MSPLHILPQPVDHELKWEGSTDVQDTPRYQYDNLLPCLLNSAISRFLQSAVFFVQLLKDDQWYHIGILDIYGFERLQRCMAKAEGATLWMFVS